MKFLEKKSKKYQNKLLKIDNNKMKSLIIFKIDTLKKINFLKRKRNCILV